MDTTLSTHRGGVDALIAALARDVARLPEAAAGDWRERGLCLAASPNLFFPSRGEPAEPAKLICAACPVTPQCREEGLRRSAEEGIWGGLTRDERKRVRAARRRNIQAAA